MSFVKQYIDNLFRFHHNNVMVKNLVAADEGALVEMTRVDVEANERLSVSNRAKQIF